MGLVISKGLTLRKEFQPQPYMAEFPATYGLTEQQALTPSTYGLTAEEAQAGLLGTFIGGGFFAGYISHTADGNPTHALIVAPRADGATGTGYTLTTNLQWKTANSATADTTSDFDGAANTAAIVTAGIADHPAAEFCVGLSIGGFSDWYLPARFELDIAYENLKPTTDSNNTNWGINDYSVPKRTVNRTAGTPAQTSIAAFQSTGAEAFLSNLHWSSTEGSAAGGWGLVLLNGNQGSVNKTLNLRVRAVRKLAL